MKNFVEEPHNAICCDMIEKSVLNMTSKDNKIVRETCVNLINDNPVHFKKYFKSEQKMIVNFLNDKHIFPARHNILKMDISRNGWNILKEAYEVQPRNYEELISLRGMGPKKFVLWPLYQI